MGLHPVGPSNVQGVAGGMHILYAGVLCILFAPRQLHTPCFGTAKSERGRDDIEGYSPWCSVHLIHIWYDRIVVLVVMGYKWMLEPPVLLNLPRLFHFLLSTLIIQHGCCC
jgi:hypothetical protein